MTIEKAARAGGSSAEALYAQKVSRAHCYTLLGSLSNIIHAIHVLS